jgi:hypothetical protein
VRTHALLGVLLMSAALALPSSVDGQSFTVLSANLSFGLFDGVRIGLTHHSRYQGYDDYCWEEAWDRRWRSYLGWGGYGSPSYDHINFYHDCVSGGLAYAYQRWHRGSIRTFRPYQARSRAFLSIVVRDPRWRTRGRHRAYDRWGRGAYPVVVGSGYRGRAVYGAYGAGRTVVTGRRSPLAEPHFKEDPHGSDSATAERGGSAARTRAVNRGAGEAGTIAAQATRRSARPPRGYARGRPQAPTTRPSGAVRDSRKGGPAATPERGRFGQTTQGKAAPRREPTAQRPTPNGRAQEARRATPRAEPRRERPSARPGGRGERSVRAPAVRRPPQR